MTSVIHSDADDFRTLPDRLTDAQQDVDDAEKALRLRRELRRRLVVQSVDDGVMSQRQIARALKRGTGLVSKILATPADEDVEE